MPQREIFGPLEGLTAKIASTDSIAYTQLFETCKLKSHSSKKLIFSLRRYKISAKYNECSLSLMDFTKSGQGFFLEPFLFQFDTLSDSKHFIG